MGRRDRSHRVLNVYGDGSIEVVDNALETAKMMEEGVETDADALRELAAAYTGYDG